MIPHNFGYIFVILAQQFFILGLVWYVMHLLDRVRQEHHLQYSTRVLANASATGDLAALATRLSVFGDKQPNPNSRPAKVRIPQEERV